MADIKISELTQAESLSTSDLLESAIPYNGGFLSRRMSLAQLSNYLENYVQHQALTTTAKTIVSAINEILGDLANYYTISQTYNKTEVDTLIAGVSGLHFLVVQQLPTTDIDVNTIYLVPKQDVGTQDIYDEYIYIVEEAPTPSHWEKIGTTEIDLSDYVTDTELTTILNDYVTSSGLSTILANYATTSAMTTALADKVDKVSGKGLSTEDYTTAEKTKVNGLATVATSGSYNDLTDKPTIPTNTDEKVKQTAISSSSNANYRLLLSKSASNTEETDGVYKDGGLYYNPYDEKLTAPNVSFSTAFIAYATMTSLITSQYYFNLGSGSAVAMLEANSASTASNPTFVTLPASSGTLALQSQIPDELADLADDETHRLVTDTQITSWNNKSDSDENVKQTDITDTSWRCIAMASDSTKTETTAGVRKTVGLSMQVNKVGTASQAGSIVLAIGNNIATGNADNYKGYLDIFNNGKRSRIYSNTTDNRNMIIPNKSGTFALTDDLPTNPVLWSENNLLGAKNLLPTPYYATPTTLNGVTFNYNSDGSISLSGRATARYNIWLRYRGVGNDPFGEFWLPNGTYKLTGGVSENVNLAVTFYKGTTWITQANDTGSGATFTVDSSSTVYNNIGCVLQIQNGTNVDGITIYPMIRLDTIADNTYTPPSQTNRQLTTLKADYRQIANVELTENASRAYAKNELMIWRGALYRVTTAISSGGAISGKVTATTLSAEIKAIRDALNI